MINRLPPELELAMDEFFLIPNLGLRKYLGNPPSGWEIATHNKIVEKYDIKKARINPETLEYEDA